MPPLKGLTQFLRFDLSAFLKDKRLVYLKDEPWKDGDVEIGSKVKLQIIEDRTQYSRPDTTNFCEQITVKVRGATSSTFSQLRPLSTEVVVNEVERAIVYGDYRNQLSIIGKIAVKGAPAKQ